MGVLLLFKLASHREIYQVVQFCIIWVAMPHTRVALAIPGHSLAPPISTHYTYSVLTFYLTVFQSKPEGISSSFSSRWKTMKQEK